MKDGTSRTTSAPVHEPERPAVRETRCIRRVHADMCVCSMYVDQGEARRREAREKKPSRPCMQYIQSVNQSINPQSQPRRLRASTASPPSVTRSGKKIAYGSLTETAESRRYRQPLGWHSPFRLVHITPIHFCTCFTARERVGAGCSASIFNTRLAVLASPVVRPGQINPLTITCLAGRTR